MNREDFIKSSIAFGIMSILPFHVLKDFSAAFPKKELMGMKRPELIGDHYLLRKECATAFEKMKTEALKENIHLYVVSSYRSFSHQKRIWESKYKSNLKDGLNPRENIQEIIKYSTIPGTSRHHWGTDIDIIDANATHPESVLETENFYDDGPYTKLKNWMDEHSEQFGFYLVYTAKKSRKGFKHEPWHFSYKPTSQKMLAEFSQLDIKKKLQHINLSGNEYFTEEFLNTYISENICSINSVLLP
ncbi:M15 family metallopeptidase [Mesonia aquimarina]|uniref:M15 family metallopeptidase n=1 Tax=Mesonia aquimarina TaxID=1504967 RepID=UPI000EF5F724|nr:M15 family metallopeptidase [Mesonia aquimarina]